MLNESPWLSSAAINNKLILGIELGLINIFSYDYSDMIEYPIDVIDVIWYFCDILLVEVYSEMRDGLGDDYQISR